uniref:Uncharacterized protein n=1 Tax=Arundo donax TaxID=35708 RepID=A0A0A9EAA7_ARUDO
MASAFPVPVCFPLLALPLPVLSLVN